MHKSNGESEETCSTERPFGRGPTRRRGRLVPAETTTSEVRDLSSFSADQKS